MPALRRKSSRSRVLDLTRRLAEEYDGIPLPDVRQSVEEAADLVTGARAGGQENLTLIERIAREELIGMTRSARTA
jgi:hypothetical protein